MQVLRKNSETVIMCNAEHKNISIFTSDSKIIRKLDSLANDYPEYYKCTANFDNEKCYSVPKNFFRVQRPF